MAIEWVDTSMLRAGDVVQCHGSRFRLATLYTSPEMRPGETAYGWTTTYLGPVDQRRVEGIPKHWRKDWHVQGNTLARWVREVSSSTTGE